MNSNKLKHNSFPQPADDTIKVWRFIDLSKLIDLLSKKQLFLSRLDLLGDSHEGSITERNYTERNLVYKENGLENIIPAVVESTISILQRSYISCWYLGNHESEAMWKLYCPDNKGVSIQTNYNTLVNSTSEDESLYIGKVTYIDYASESFRNNNIFNPIMHKRIAFQHESEVRLVKLDSDKILDKSIPINTGIYHPWDVNKFAENIYVNPYAPEWYYEVIKEILNKYDCTVPLKWSNMRKEPLF